MKCEYDTGYGLPGLKDLLEKWPEYDHTQDFYGGFGSQSKGADQVLILADLC